MYEEDLLFHLLYERLPSPVGSFTTKLGICCKITMRIIYILEGIILPSIH